jgi:hypothetical protein
MVGQQLSIPQILLIPHVARLAAKILIHPLPLLGGQSAWPTRSLRIRQASKSAFLKTPNPALNGGRVLTKQIRHLIATQPSTDQQYSMKSMIIPSLFRPRNLLLNRKAHNLSVGYLKLSHLAALLNMSVSGGQVICKNFMLHHL